MIHFVDCSPASDNFDCVYWVVLLTEWSWSVCLFTTVYILSSRHVTCTILCLSSHLHVYNNHSQSVNGYIGNFSSKNIYCNDVNKHIYSLRPSQLNNLFYIILSLSLTHFSWPTLTSSNLKHVILVSPGLHWSHWKAI